MEAYIKTKLNLDEVAGLVRAAVNAAAENQTTYQREQRRQSVNYGGVYYLFEVFGLTLILVRMYKFRISPTPIASAVG
jgi:hypothetical protein